ncbi:hypothetical protein FRC17_001334, partial [Serendipita sp. 399]
MRGMDRLGSLVSPAVIANDSVPPSVRNVNNTINKIVYTLYVQDIAEVTNAVAHPVTPPTK